MQTVGSERLVGRLQAVVASLIRTASAGFSLQQRTGQAGRCSQRRAWALAISPRAVSAATRSISSRPPLGANP